ncbi:MAG TPA: T9SS type A sorting domain-containing protein, partial [Bacteroidia bacterium]|nr:T9SS type A sorting domain-containing protein [Bacteroidia bacterium]
TYNALRVVSTIVEQDSVYIDSLGFGLNLPAVTTVEYKWLANGEGIPVLQINTTATGTVTQIRYKDAPLTTGVQSLNPISDLTAYPNPASNILTVRWNAANAASVSLELSDLQGRIVFSDQLHGVAGTNIRVVDLASLHLAEGPYLLRLNDRVTNIQVRD